MDWLTISGAQPWDGRYPFDLENSAFTTREWGWIKRHSGYLPLTVDEGFKGADPELITVFAIIALARAGKIQTAQAAEVFDRLADAPATARIRLETDEPEREADADPPPQSSTENGSSSGHDSPTSSEISPAAPSPSGIPVSASSRLARGTWEV